MGCDIHLYVEKKHKDKWVMVHEVRGEGRQRNYRRFASIAGVRGDGPEPKGLPLDVSESVSMHADDWDGDGHSHSWLPMAEAIQAWQQPHFPDDKPVEWPLWHHFEIDNGDDADLSEYRVVFWFDN